jgi:glycogen operon protein
MHIDGFRFDLASILSRDEQGVPLQNPPILWDIETDPILVNTKFIAEAWDAAGLYQVGTFVGERWKEWNGRFRDDVRSFFKVDRETAGKMALRLLASPDIYGHEDREPEQSVNFITCHDGFTLNDLVSYNQKHNGANGEDNRDGSDNNSLNMVEGPSKIPRSNPAQPQVGTSPLLAIEHRCLGWATMSAVPAGQQQCLPPTMRSTGLIGIQDTHADIHFAGS